MKTKSIFSFILVMLGFGTFAQDIQPIDTTKWLCQYNYEFLQDTTSRNSLKSDQMYLQIGSHLSKFTCAANFVTDSVLYLVQDKVPTQDDFDQVMKSVSGTRSSVFSMYTIYKNYPQKRTMLFTAYIDNYYKVQQQMQMNWKLDSRKDTVILGYSCKKAYTSYAGRDYIAWYALQIPLPDGPYKFNGLPGLILKIYDTKMLHCFTLNSFKKISYPQAIMASTKKCTVITANEYNQIVKNDLMRIYKDLQSGEITSNSEEGKVRAMHGLMGRNNFIEKF